MPIGEFLLNVADGIYYLSSIKAMRTPVSGSYIIRGEKVYLVETGTTEVASLLLRSLDNLGISKEEVAGIIATHIHLDHFGGAGWLVQQMPWLKVYVHISGAKHLMDPSRLLAGAEVVYGGREAVLRIHGAVYPVPQSNIVPVEEASIDVGCGKRLRLLPAPGHAPHHMLIMEESTGIAFVGELTGHYIPEYDVLYPALSPPGFDYSATLASLEKLRALSPKVLCFSQFGFTEKVEETMALSLEQVSRLNELILQLYRRGAGDEEMVKELLGDTTFSLLSSLDHGESVEEIFMSAVMAFREYFRRKEQGPGLAPAS